MSQLGQIIFEQPMTFFPYWVKLTEPYLFGHVGELLHAVLWDRYQDEFEA